MSRASAIAARKQGDDYQALFFWRRAVDLFHPTTHIVQVGFECPDAGSFDDVVARYDDVQVYAGHQYQVDFCQLKYHVRDENGYGWEDLTRPGFINSKTDTLLQRLHAVQKRHAPDGDGCRCLLLTPMVPRPKDHLARLRSNDDGRLECSRLAATAAWAAEIRKSWSAHLELDDSTHLERVLRPLRLVQGPTLQGARDELAQALRTAGLHDDVDAYVQLYDQLLIEESCSFDTAQMKARLRQEGLWRGGPSLPSPTKRVLVRSRMRGAENLHVEVDDALCLCDLFDDRETKDPAMWQVVVWPRITEWLAVLRGDAITFHLGALHTSLSLGLGYCLDTRSGVYVALVQSGTQGDQVWLPTPAALPVGERLPQWEFGESQTGTTGPETALVIGVARDIVGDVRAYCLELLPAVGRIVSARMPNPGTSAVLGPEHGQRLVEDLVQYMQEARPASARRNVLHVFAAAPNALLFRLGQHLRGMGSTQCYEFGFDTTYTYSPSLRFPPPAEAGLVGQGG